MTIRSTLLALTSLAALGCATAAQAQTADAAQDQAAAQSPDDIVVTAQLVAQKPIEVPFALTTYSGKFLTDLGITEFDSLSRYVPGFLVQDQSPNNPGFVMRGITSDDGSAFNEPRVSVFQDGVSISKSRGSYVELFDLDRVEVAKGPQSTLYGRGALIGAVNLVEAKADPSAPYGYFYGSYGNYHAYRIDGTVNLPITDMLAIRFAGRVKERDGDVDNLLGYEPGKSDRDDFNSIETDAGRVSLHWAPQKFTLDLIGNYQSDHTAGTSFKSIAYDPTDPVTGEVLGDRGRNSGAALAPHAGFEGGKPLGVDRRVYGVTAIGKYQFNDEWSLDATASARHFDGEEVFDADGISLPILTAAEDARGNQQMGTLRLTYSTPKVTAFAGATYFHEDGLQRAPAEFDERYALARLANVLNGGGAIPGRPADEPAPESLLGNPAFGGQILQGIVAQGIAAKLIQAGIPAAQAPGLAQAQAAALLPTALAQGIAANLNPNYLESYTNYGRTNSVDVFGDATFHVTDKFEIGGGLRYTHDDKTTGYASSITQGRSIIAAFQYALSLPAAQAAQLLKVLATPGAANFPASASFPLFGLSTQATANNGDVISQNYSDQGLTWRATARYAASDQASFYATYARGRRPDVLSASSPSVPFGAPNFQVVPSEKVDSYEVGVKTALAHHTLFVDGAVFYYNYSNFQTTIQQGTQFVTANAGKADSYGFEGQVRWTPRPWMTVFANYAYNHGRFKNGAFEGNHFRLSPDNTASGGFTLSAPLGAVKLDFSPSVTYQSKIFFDDNNDRPDLQTQNLIPDLIQDEFQDGYMLVNARLGIEPGHGGWRLEAFVNNLTNRKYITDAGNTGDALGMPTFIAGEPRFYGLAFSMKWGGR